MVYSKGVCYSCKSEFRMFTIEWPAKVIVCPNCEKGMTLAKFDEYSRNVLYKKIL